MDDRPIRRMALTFALAAGISLAAWVAIALMMNLDELFEFSGTGSELARELGRRYAGLLRSPGPWLFAVIGTGSVVLIRSRNHRAPSFRPGP